MKEIESVVCVARLRAQQVEAAEKEVGNCLELLKESWIISKERVEVLFEEVLFQHQHHIV